MNPMKRSWAVAVVASFLACADALAQMPENITDLEVALLPGYCRDTWGFGRGPWSADPKWLEIMGPGFMAMHHYCWALIKLRRVEKPGVPAVMQQGYRESALGDLFYVVKNSQRDFVMLPEIYTKIGEVQLLLKRYSNAAETFQLARSLKPDYWPAYFHWAEYLRQSGHKSKARALVEEGLAYAPDAKPLQNLLVTLGGDPKAIQPRQSPPTASAP
jgi:tetratricopeptide (TPR) repeat protein